MHDCEFLKHCQVWEQCPGSIKHIWINGYCKGPKQPRCARLQLARQARPIPQDLLPNGTSLPR